MLGRVEPGTLLILDEVWRIWPAGLKASEAEESDKALLAEHRHRVGNDGRAMEICLIVQDLGNIATFARNLVETTFVATKLTAVGQAKKYRIDVYQGSRKGPQYPSNLRLREIYGTYKKEVFQYYVSHTQAVGGMVGDERKVDNRATVMGSYLIKVVVPLGIVAIVLGVWQLVGFFRPHEDTKAVDRKSVV